jgi:DNA polymerase III, epsilon subunit and related 3''-5'' exonucleases
MSGYAVIDLETTGFAAWKTDRVVEIAVVLVSESGQVEGEWASLVNPGRDVGPTRIHGITAAEVIGAPTFAALTPQVLASVSGRTIVAHNSRFDTGFLAAELQRAGVPLGELPLPSLCTMEWAPAFLSAQSRRLEDCCSAAGIRLDNAHSALGDARATAGLLTVYLSCCGFPTPWQQANDRCACYPWPTYVGGATEVRLVERSTERPRRPDAWLDRIVARLPRAEAASVDAYLELLSRALVDLQLSVHEQVALVDLAESLGLCREQLLEVHCQYLDAMGALALADGVVTDQERSDLEQVAQCLGLGADAVARALSGEPVGQPVAVLVVSLEPGDRIVVTGDTRRPREDWIALINRSGLEFGGVTKRTKVVVAADPDSLSGKARKARDYGVPIIDETTFERLFADYLRRQD